MILRILLSKRITKLDREIEQIRSKYATYFIMNDYDHEGYLNLRRECDNEINIVKAKIQNVQQMIIDMDNENK